MKPLLVVLLLSSIAAADTTKLTGDKAQALMTALKHATLKPAVTKTKLTWTAKVINCFSKEKTDDGLGDYSCEVDDQKLVNAPAYVLRAGLQAAGVAEKYGMNAKRTNARALTCTDELSAKGDANVYTCAFE